jgi:hypothetical protein
VGNAVLLANSISALGTKDFDAKREKETCPLLNSMKAKFNDGAKFID